MVRRAAGVMPLRGCEIYTHVAPPMQTRRRNALPVLSSERDGLSAIDTSPKIESHVDSQSGFSCSARQAAR